MTKKIKILHIINNLQIGGAEKILVLLLKKLSKLDDVELYLVSLEGHGPLIKELPANIIIKEFKYNVFPGGIIGRIDPYFRLGLLKYVWSIKPDIIHGHLLKAEDFAKVLGIITRTPVIITLHDTLFKPDFRTRFLNKFLSRVVSVSEVVKEYANKTYRISKDKIIVIPNAVEVDLFKDSKKNFNKNKPVFMYIGRLLKLKGIEDAIRGLAKLKNDYPDMEFLIYGKESTIGYRNYLEKLTSDNEWNFVKFMGSTNNVPAALSECDIFISPSQSEGFAISVLEATAAGKPVIATKTGAIPDMIQDGVSGLFVEWNRPDQIYNAAKSILDNNLVEDYGSAAVKIAEKCFDIDNVTDMHLQLYKTVLRFK